MKSGVLNFYKEKGYTSHDAVAKIRKLYGTRKVGHTGTLDPQAEGVLPILIGSAAKACDLIGEESKIYRATVRFGLATDTEDVWGNLLREDSARPEKEAFLKAMESFVGAGKQIPPMMSAVKIGGKKLYEYLREGKEVERPARDVFVHSLTLLSFNENEAELRCEVSKGTYIRTLLTDICAKVGVLGSMSSLVREKSGKFHLADALKEEELSAMTKEEREEALLPTEKLFSEHAAFEPEAFYHKLIANGCAVSLSKLGLGGTPVGTRFRLTLDGEFFALAEVISEDGEEKLFKIKNFPPDEA